MICEIMINIVLLRNTYILSCLFHLRKPSIQYSPNTHQEIALFCDPSWILLIRSFNVLIDQKIF